MSEIEISIADSLPDRLKLDRVYDVECLQAEVLEIVGSLVQQFYVYYSAVPLVTGIEDPGSHDWEGEEMLKGCDYLKGILGDFRTEIASVRLMRLEGGADLKEYTDPMLDAVHREVVRLTLPVITDETVCFLLNGSEVPMKPGELWYLRLSDPHSVENLGSSERINISIDVRWNDWMEEWLGENL